MEKVLVTGGSGYIAQHCIAELLKKGYSVRTSLRSENREAEVRQAIACLLYTSDAADEV